MSRSGTNQRIADRLLADGRLTPEQHRLASAHATRHKTRIEEALIELDILKEGDLLKYIATIYNTRFVSAEKLSKAVIDPKVLTRVPKRSAELHNVFPVILDDQASVLSVVTADPDNDVAFHEIKLAARVREVRALVARPAAVRAAIQQYYNGDSQAFAAVLRPGMTIDYLQSSYDRQLPGDARATPAPQAPQPAPAPMPVQQPMPAMQTGQSFPTMQNLAANPALAGAYGAPMMPGGYPPHMAPGMNPYAPQMGLAGPAFAAMPQNPFAAMQMQQPYGPMMPGMPGMPGMPTMGQMPMPAPAPAPPPAPAPEPAPPTPAAPAAPARTSAAPESGGATSHGTAPSLIIAPTATQEYVETLNVLVSLLENSRAELRGHSSAVARVVKRTCERIGLPTSSVSAFMVAAYLHDLGKMGTYHLTALNVAEYEGHRIAALKVTDLPAQLMGSVGLAQETIAAMGAMYERYDGQGFPNGQAGKEIPLGARILAVADTYADLTQNPRNPFRKILRPAEACEALDQFRGKVFDPNIVDLFRQAMTGDDMRARLLADRHHVLIVDPDPEETTVLELRLIEQGFEVRIARTAAQAKKELENREIAAVVSEIDLEEPAAGLTLRAEALRASWGKELTWVFVTSKADRQSAQQAFELAVDDFVAKPASGDLVAAKLRQIIERRAANTGGRGVSGSLAEMGLPDMVQILWHGRKTCALKITSRGSNGEIDFADGQIVHATWGSLKGEDAFYKMLTLREGDFRLDPSYTPTVRSIEASPEGLLLEGMRRLDEGRVTED